MFNKTVSKIILLGDSAVGKTSLLNSYVDKKFVNSYKTTIGADFMDKQVVADGKVINLQIWDTAGQEKFRSLGSAFYRGAECCVLVYDITKKSSWISQFLIQGQPKDSENFPFVLIGNKIDKQAQREVEQSLVKDFLEKHPKIIHLLTSAKLSQGVQMAFQKIALRSIENNNKQMQNCFKTDLVLDWLTRRQLRDQKEIEQRTKRVGVDS